MECLDPQRDTGVFLLETEGEAHYLIACSGSVTGVVVVCCLDRKFNGKMIVGYCTEHSCAPLRLGRSVCLSPPGDAPSARHTNPITAIHRITSALVVGEQFVVWGDDELSRAAQALADHQRKA